MGKARATKKRRKKPASSRGRNRSSAGQAPWVIAIGVAVCLLMWLANAGFQDRHWSAFQEAGDRAFGRGNYAYAQRMYDSALDEAEHLDPHGEQIVQTLLALSRTYKAREEPMLADAMLTRARAARAARANRGRR